MSSGLAVCRRAVQVVNWQPQYSVISYAGSCLFFLLIRKIKRHSRTQCVYFSKPIFMLRRSYEASRTRLVGLSDGPSVGLQNKAW